MGRRVAGKSTLRQRRSGSRVPSGPRTPDAKIFPPELPPACVARPALENGLDEVFDHRVAVVVAGAGFGKSTLVAQWARRNRVAWYSVDSADCSLAVDAVRSEEHTSELQSRE